VFRSRPLSSCGFFPRSPKRVFWCGFSGKSVPRTRWRLAVPNCSTRARRPCYTGKRFSHWPMTDFGFHVRLPRNVFLQRFQSPLLSALIAAASVFPILSAPGSNRSFPGEIRLHVALVESRNGSRPRAANHSSTCSRSSRALRDHAHFDAFGSFVQHRQRVGCRRFSFVSTAGCRNRRRCRTCVGPIAGRFEPPQKRARSTTLHGPNFGGGVCGGQAIQSRRSRRRSSRVRLGHRHEVRSDRHSTAEGVIVSRPASASVPAGRRSAPVTVYGFNLQLPPLPRPGCRPTRSARRFES